MHLTGIVENTHSHHTHEHIYKIELCVCVTSNAFHIGIYDFLYDVVEIRDYECR